MKDYTETYEKMQELVTSYRAWVTAFSSFKSVSAKVNAIECIEVLIDVAAANGMSKDELDELAEVEW